jgi:hypothetical protein
MNLSSQFAEIPDFKFDRRSGRYRHKSGRFAARAEVMRLMRENILVQREDLIALADRVEAKQITLTEFQIESAQLLKRIHVQSAVLGKDGIDNMTPQDWLEVARELKRQYYAGKDEATGRRFGLKYLAQSLRDGLLSQPQLKNALRMFANSARTSFHRASLALDQIKGKAFGIRVRTKADSCASCIRYADLPPQPIGQLILPTQKCECGTNCGCRIVTLSLVEAIARGMPADFADSGGLRKDARGQWRDAQGQFADPPSGSNPIVAHVESSAAIQSAAAKSSRFAAGLAKVKSLPASALAKLNTQLEQNPTMAEDLGVVAIAMAGQFAIMPSADPGTAALLQSSIGVMARSGLQIKKRIVAELKLDPAALKSVSGAMAVSKKLLSDFQRPDVQEKLIGDALGPALGTSANLAAGGGTAGMIAGTIAGVKGTPIAAAKIQQSTRKST